MKYNIPNRDTQKHDRYNRTHFGKNFNKVENLKQTFFFLLDLISCIEILSHNSQLFRKQVYQFIWTCSFSFFIAVVSIFFFFFQTGLC